MPVMTVIIPTLDRGPALKRCLSSLAEQTFSDFDILIVCNGRRVDEHDLNLGSGFERRTRLIVSESNRGYGAACNMGAHATDASYLLFLNDDTFLRDDCLEEIYKSLCSSENTLFQPMIRHEYARQTRAGNPCDIFGAAGLGFYGNCGTGEFFASGACLAVSKTTYDYLGGFDEKFFLYYDDVDLSWRARLVGFNVSATTNTLCFHSGGKSSIAMPHEIKFYLTQRNRIRVFIKNYSMQRIFTRLLVVVCLILGGAFFFAIRNRRVRYVECCLRAFGWNLKMLPNTLVERSLVQGRRVRNDLLIVKSMSQQSIDICVLKRAIADM
jgi:GT2 family glycosyltransferase